MKLPKKVLIAGKEYTVKRDRTQSTGWGRGNTIKREITVGAKDRNCEEAFETFVHEITEVAMLENNLRFNRDSNDEFFYKINHPEFGRFASDVAIALFPMVKR